MSNFLYSEFSDACVLHRTNPTAWVYSNGLSDATPSVIKKGARPRIETLKKMMNGWNDEVTRSKIVVAYLKDEVERLGASLDEFQISASGVDPDSSTLDEDLKTVQRFMNKKPIRESMHKLALILKVAEQEESHELIKQAEEIALIQRAQRKKKSAKSAS